MVDAKSHLGSGSKTHKNYQNKERKESLFMMISSLTAHKTNAITLKFNNFKYFKIAPAPSQSKTELPTSKKTREQLRQFPPSLTKSKNSFENTIKQSQDSITISKPVNKKPKETYGIQKRFTNERRVYKMKQSSLISAKLCPNDMSSSVDANSLCLSKPEVQSLKIVQSLQNKINYAHKKPVEENLKLNCNKFFKDEAFQVQQTKMAILTPEDGSNAEKRKNDNNQPELRAESVIQIASTNVAIQEKKLLHEIGHCNLACVVWDSELKPKKHLPPLKITRFRSPEAEQLFQFKFVTRNGQLHKAANSHKGVEWISMFKSKGFRPGSSRSFPTKGELEIMKSRDWVEDNPMCYAAKYSKYIGLESRDAKSRAIYRQISEQVQ